MAGFTGQISISKKLVQDVAPVVGLLFVCSFITLEIVIPATGQMSYGFIGRYTASQLLAQGEFGPQVYDDAWFAARVQAVARQPIVEIFTPNLPTLSLLTVPLVWLPPQAARDVWIWANLLVWGIALGILGTTSTQRSTLERWALLVAFVAVIPALAANFRVGQVYTLLLFFFVVALFGLITERGWLAGLALGLALVFKTSGLLFWLLLLRHKRWRALGWAVGTVLLIAIVSLPWIGLDTWLAYPPAVWSFGNRPAISVTAYQTTASFFAHLYQYDPVWNPTPVMHWPVLGKFLTALVTVVAVALTLRLGKTDSSLPDQFAALTSLNIILLPVAEEYHFVLLIIPLFIFVSGLTWPPFGPVMVMELVLLALAVVLLIAPIPYKEPLLLADWPVVVTYPRLAAGWLIWLAAVTPAYREAVRGWSPIFRKSDASRRRHHW